MKQQTISEYCAERKCKPTIPRHLQKLIKANKADTLLKKWNIQGWQVVGKTYLLNIKN